MMSFPHTKIALVIPTLNEAGNSPTLLDRLAQAVAELPLDCEFIIVDESK